MRKCWEELRAILMTAWPAGVPMDNVCIVRATSTPPGTVLDTSRRTLDEAQQR